MDITICLTYVVKFASDPTYQSAVQNNTAIDLKALDPIHAAFRAFKHRSEECMVRSDLGSSYNNHSNTIQYFPTLLASTLLAVGGTPPAASPPPPPTSAKRPGGNDAATDGQHGKKSQTFGC